MPPALNALFAHLPQTPENPLATWQERILFTILLLGSTFGLLAVASSIKLVLYTREWCIACAILAAYLWWVACLFLAHKVPLAIRAGGTLVALFGIGAASMVTSGLVGSGRLHLFTVTILACLLLGTRAGVLALMMSCGAITAAAFLTLKGLAPGAPHTVFNQGAWTVTGLTFLLLTGMTLGMLAVLMKGLKTALQKARQEIRTLKGIHPICANCKRIRNGEGGWQQIEDYIQQHSEATFSHSICPECTRKLYPHLFEKKSDSAD